MTRKGLLAGFFITDDTTLDFMEFTQQKGVMHLSLTNKGTSTLVIDDFSQQEISPESVFVIESPVAICNTSFRLKFKKEYGQENKVIVRYIVENETFIK